MTDYQQLKKDYFKKYPHGRLQYRGYHDIFSPDYSERRNPFIYIWVSEEDPEKLCDDLNHEAWQFDETLTNACWADDFERFGGLCHTFDCKHKVDLGVPYCDPCIAANLLASSLSLKMNLFEKAPEEVVRLAKRSPIYQRHFKE